MRAHFSLRATQGLTIVVMGLLAVALALTTGEVYRHLAVANQRVALSDQVGLKARDLLRELEDRSRDVGLQLQYGPIFRQAFDAADATQLHEQLRNQFHQYFVTAGVLKLERLDAHDADFRPIATSVAEDSPLTADTTTCPGLIERARGRVGADRLKSLSELCLYRGKLYLSVIVPIGGLRPRGYIEVVTDPTQSLKPVEAALRMPLQIVHANGELAYRSDAWPQGGALARMLVASHELLTASDEPAIVIAVASDMHNFHEELQTTRYWVVLIVGIATAIAVLLALWTLQRTAVGPLDTLRRHMSLLRRDRKHLGEPIAISGNSEINQLADGFNDLSAELKKMYQELERMAYTDALTQIPNRMLLHDRLQQAIIDADRHERLVALLYMDLDRFKGINDSLGHEMGDMLLKQVAQRLQNCVRPGDTVARPGGDEFIVVLASVAHVDDVSRVTQKLIDAFSLPFEVGGRELFVTCSIGITLYPFDDRDIEMLYRNADAAMYHAKDEGRNNFQFYSAEMNTQSYKHLTMENALRHALERAELRLYYQPQVDLRSGRIVGAEALIRWQHPELGLVSPADFIPLAEETGLIVPIGAWVLRQACAEARAWQDAGLPAVRVAVNLSARQFRQQGLFDVITAALQHAGLEPKWLEVEVTESMVMRDVNRTIDVLRGLEQMGVSIAIDDFGTGYSSLSYLRRLPIDVIKIDRSFIEHIPDNADDAAIATAIIALAKSLQLKVVGEGIETRAQLDFLRRHGCDTVQGYYYARPLPAEEFLRFLHQGPLQPD